jgi:amylosucrase
MPWDVAARRHDPSTLEGRVFALITHLGAVRRSMPSLHAAVESVPVQTTNPAVLAVVRRHAAGDVVQLYNMSEDWQRCDVGVLGTLSGLDLRDALSSTSPRIEGGELVLPPYAALWLVEA